MANKRSKQIELVAVHAIYTRHGGGPDVQPGETFKVDAQIGERLLAADAARLPAAVRRAADDAGQAGTGGSETKEGDETPESGGDDGSGEGGLPLAGATGGASAGKS